MSIYSVILHSVLKQFVAVSNVNLFAKGEMKMAKMKSVGSFEELVRLYPSETASAKLAPPPKVNLPKLEGADVENLREWFSAGKQARQWIMAVGLPFLEKFEKEKREFGPRYLELADEDGKTNEQKKIEVEATINWWSNCEEPIGSQNAELAKLLYRLLKPMDFQKFSAMLSELAKQKIVVEDKNGNIRPFASKFFSLCPDAFKYIRDDAQSLLKEAIESQGKRIMSEREKKIRSKESEMKAKVEITPQEAWNGGTGICFLGSSKNSNVSLLICAEEEYVSILDGVSWSEKMQEGIDNVLAFQREEFNLNLSIRWKDVKEDGKVRQERKMEIFYPPEISNAEDRGVWRAGYIQLCWVLREAFTAVLQPKSHANQTDERRQARPNSREYDASKAPSRVFSPKSVEETKAAIAKMKVRANLAPEQFHKEHVEFVPGFYCIVKDWWRNFDQVAEPLAFLLEVFEDGTKFRFIKIVETLPHCEEFLSACTGKDFAIMAKWEGIPAPLGNLLRRNFAEKIASKAEQEHAA